MRCIFCKEPSDTCTSVEHVVPESLGNKTHVLPPGVVCDSCNNYFAGKVEQLVLESEYFKALRFADSIPSKKGKYPGIDGIVYPDAPVQLSRDRTGLPHLPLSGDIPSALRAVNYLSDPNGGRILFPANDPALPDEKIFSRFMAKVGLEALALRFLPHPGGHEYVVNETQLDPVRNYARRGSMIETWPISVRRIYSGNHAFRGRDERWEQVLFEFDFLYTDSQELYFVLAVMGLQFVLNMGGAELEGYHEWCAASPGKSPLHPDGVPANLADV
jgi:HNH endonuclease